MQPINKTPKGKAERRENLPQNNLSQSDSRGRSMVNTNYPLPSDSSITLYRRDLAVPGIAETTQVEEINEVFKVVKSFILAKMGVMNGLLKQHRKFNLVKECKSTDSIEEILCEWAKLYSEINKFPKIKQEVNNSKVGLTGEAFKHLDINPILNGMYSWLALGKIFQGYYVCAEVREIFSNFQLSKNPGEIIIKELDVLVRQTIIDLEKFKKEYYFETFKLAVNHGLDFKAKMEALAKYRDFDDNLSFLDLPKKQCVDSFLQRFDEYIIKFEKIVTLDLSLKTLLAGNIQVLIDCFQKIRNLPKTLPNLKVGCEVLKQCHVFFVKKGKVLVDEVKGFMPTLFDEYNTEASYLFNLQKHIDKLITEAMIEIEADLCQTNSSNKKPQKKQLKPIENSIKENRFEVKTISKKMENNRPEMDITTPVLSVQEELDKDSLEEIEEEVNILMKEVLKLYAVFGEKKREQKKEKLNKAKSVIEQVEEPVIPVIEKKVIIEILSPKHQETIRALFVANSGHGEISGNRVQTLIVALGGKSVGASGSKFTIHWNGSLKHGGEYEIMHGGDLDGYLTSAYAKRVADAIYSGIQIGAIEEKLFPEELLKIVEDYGTSSFNNF